MLAEESLREGNLAETLARLQEQVRKDPSNSKLRVFLFQLLTVMGDWDRALNQLSVVRDMDAGTIPMAQAYTEALKCEKLRKEIFAGQRSPVVFGEPEQWVALLMQALKLTAEGQHAQAAGLREDAFESAPATGGTLDGKAFEWIADADSRMGPVLEAIINGRYCWIPFHRISRIDIEEPEDLRDLVWMPAHFAWENGGEVVGLIPTRYPDSEASQDGQIRMARKTEWLQKADDVYVGLGQRMLATNEEEFPLMGVREIRLGSDASAAGQ